jgi:hypothetical protein
MNNQSPNPALYSPPGEDDKLWAVLTHIFNPIIPIATLLMDDKKNQPYLRYNAILALTWAAINLVLSILGVGICLAPIGNIVLAVLAFQGKPLEIPFLTNLFKQQGWLQ